MSASDNKTATQAAYQAFANADLNGAMQDMADDIEWIVPGNSTISRTYRGKDEVRQLFVTLAGKSFRTEPEHFVADGDHVVVLTRVTADGQSSATKCSGSVRKDLPANVTKSCLTSSLPRLVRLIVLLPGTIHSMSSAMSCIAPLRSAFANAWYAAWVAVLLSDADIGISPCWRRRRFHPTTLSVSRQRSAWPDRYHEAETRGVRGARQAVVTGGQRHRLTRFDPLFKSRSGQVPRRAHVPLVS